MSVDVTVTFAADHAAKKESMLSDVQVAGVKASAVQAAVVARGKGFHGAAIENEKSERLQIANVI